jgi:hypothetical protein
MPCFDLVAVGAGEESCVPSSHTHSIAHGISYSTTHTSVLWVVAYNAHITHLGLRIGGAIGRGPDAQRERSKVRGISGGIAGHIEQAERLNSQIPTVMAHNRTSTQALLPTSTHSNVEQQWFLYHTGSYRGLC